MKIYVLLRPEGQADKQLLQSYFDDPIPWDALIDKKKKNIWYTQILLQNKMILLLASQILVFINNRGKKIPVLKTNKKRKLE